MSVYGFRGARVRLVSQGLSDPDMLFSYGVLQLVACKCKENLLYIVFRDFGVQSSYKMLVFTTRNAQSAMSFVQVAADVRAGWEYVAKEVVKRNFDNTQLSHNVVSVLTNRSIVSPKKRKYKCCRSERSRCKDIRHLRKS